MLRLAHICRKASVPIFNGCLTHRIIFSIQDDATSLPYQFNFKWTKQEKKKLFGKRIQPKLKAQFHDVLTLPGYEGSNAMDIYSQFMERDIPISAQNVTMLIHTFINNNLMTEQAFGRIEVYAYRHRGEYKLRSIFGGIRGCLIFNKNKLMQFFVKQFQASESKFTIYEMLELVEALNINKSLTKAQKLEFWEQYLKKDFIEGFSVMKASKVKLIIRVFDAFVQLGQYDKELWERIIFVMGKKRGWGRIPLLERLYKISGTFESAKVQFDTYFQKLSTEDRILRRYNLTELRFYTPLEVIKIAEENPSDYFPKTRTLVPEGENAEQWNQQYERFLLTGAIKEEQQIIKDKSKSLGYAIRDRYEFMQTDHINLSELTKEEFAELFGNYDEAMAVLNKPHPQGVESGILEQGEQQGQQQK